MRKQFDIKYRSQIESGEYKVETQNGCTARIICWDRKDNNYPIIALFEEGKSGKECLLSYTQNGQHVKGISNVSDLVIVTPEPELSEFEKKLSDVFGYAISMSVSDPKKPTDEFVREYAPELLSLAREQLQPEIDAEIEKAYKTADEVMYRKGKEDGIAEARNDITARIIALKQAKDRAEGALKDLPRWKPSNCPRSNLPSLYLTGDGTALYKDGYEISISGLEKLPKEETNL